jgi:hypothetical protein
MLIAEAEYGGETCLFPVRIKDPGGWPLAAIDRMVRDAKTTRGDEVTNFRRVMAIARLPLPIRGPLEWLALNIGRQRPNFFGTFVIAGMSELGVESQHILSPLSNCLSYGVIANDGNGDLRMYWDHRVMDGVVVGKALGRLEQILNEPIADELLAGAH